MPLPQDAYTDLAGMHVCRLLNGLWQLSGAHGHIAPQPAVKQMLDYHNAGLTTWDLADHYGPAEDFIGAFRDLLTSQGGADALADHRAFTKWVPRPGAMPREKVEAAIDRSRQRMKADTLDMLQFHWWDYTDPRYIDALKHMTDLRTSGKIRHLALTNFDTPHLKHIIDEGIEIVSNQVQFSIIDRRPEVDLIPYCQQSGIKLLTYGTLAGGLLTDRYLDKPEPTPPELNTASLRKYMQMIHAWGNWDLFQQLLRTLRAVADKHHVSIANVAVRYILDKPAVAGVIVGARLSINEHITENARVFEFALDADDLAKIHGITKQARSLYQIIGDTGDEYRR